ncbi:MAG: hypothetical protein P5700_24440 [Arthrospira platensis PCC 7345]|nr:hypothetical protein [Arthrospira platensis PCC 7345]
MQLDKHLPSDSRKCDRVASECDVSPSLGVRRIAYILGIAIASYQKAIA